MTALLAAQFIGVLLATIVSLVAPLVSRRALRRLHHIAAAIGNHHWLSIILVGLVSLVINATISMAVHWPQPAVHDEFAYLLAADTFAAGRLTNPPPPSREHFETYHVIVRPTYQSKYPPGQGLALALGQSTFGSALVGVWLSLAVACMTVCWMLQGWATPRWAMIGGLLVATNPAMIVAWGQTYWGGAVAMLGGALVFGAVGRIAHRRPAGLSPVHLAVYSTLLGTGLLILANSRPFEGLIASAPAILVLLITFVRLGPGLRARWSVLVCTPIAVLLIMGALWFTIYNKAVTHDALKMPYQAWHQQYGGGDGPLPAAASLGSHLTSRARYPKLWVPDEATAINRELIDRRRAWCRNVPAKFFLSLFFYLGAFIVVLPAAAIAAARRLQTAIALCTAMLVVLVVALEPTVGNPHYAAPVTSLFAFVMVTGLRHLMALRRMVVIQFSAAAILLAALLVGPVAAALDQASRRGVGMAADRAMILAQLKATPSQDLVFVRYGPTSLFLNEWVYNRADLDRAEVVWARDMGPAKNVQLLEYLRDRRVWLLQADARPPRLQPYESGATTENDRAARELAETAPTINADIR